MLQYVQGVDMITKDLLHELYSYSDGKIFHKRETKGNIINNSEVGYVDNHKHLFYRKTKINRRCYKVHHLIWIMHYGDIPKDKVIDHIDGNGLNNNIDNLRLVTQADNTKNARLYKNNKSGYQGVSWYKNRDMWRVSIGNNGTQETIGYFEDLNEAIEARKKKEIEYGYHKNHGRA